VKVIGHDAEGEEFDTTIGPKIIPAIEDDSGSCGSCQYTFRVVDSFGDGIAGVVLRESTSPKG
jgi:hypothetical protein